MLAIISTIWTQKITSVMQKTTPLMTVLDITTVMC